MRKLFAVLFCGVVVIAVLVGVARSSNWPGQLIGIADTGAGAPNQFGTGWPFPVATSPYSSITLDVGTVTTAGTPYTAIVSGHHGKGGWIRNCNATGTMYVNDQGSASSTELGSNAALVPGTGGSGGLYTVPPGTQSISVTGTANSMIICGEAFN